MFPSKLLFFGAACPLYVLAATQELQLPYSTFYSRPDLKAPSLNISLHDSRVSPGYLFISPHFNAAQKPDAGPYIFDNAGNLVWSGLDAAAGAGASDVQGLYVCSYQDQDHLCFWQGLQRGMHGSGLGIIMNHHYQIVKTIQSCSATASTDLHEFQLTPGGTALITIYQPRFYNGLWILDCIFQEISLVDNQLAFEWSALDHIDPSESHVPAGSFGLAGDGSSPDRSWDYFHINSIDKNDDGDYLISARHTDCILKVSHSGGSIIWQLSGDNSSFHLSNFTFRRQHHARFQEDSTNRTIISLLNNDNDGFTVTGAASAGLVVEIDHLSKSATKLAEYRAPVKGGIIAKGMGSMGYLPSGNILLSWGTGSAMTEFLADGTPIWHADMGWKSLNYRAYKSQWLGKPVQPPALWTYAKSTRSPTAFYVSWNGATEIKIWQFYASASQDGEYKVVRSVPKDGFETIYVDDIYRPWTFVEAIDVNGVGLRNSTKVRTYVPDDDAGCGATDCLPAITGIVTAYVGGSWAEEASKIQIATACEAPPFEGRHFWRWAEIFLEAIGLTTCIFAGFWSLLRSVSQPASYKRLSSTEK